MNSIFHPHPNTTKRSRMFMLTMVAAFFSTASCGNVYKQIDPRGQVSYSDTPASTDDEPVPLPHLQVYQAAPYHHLRATQAVPATHPATYQSLTIIHPEPNEAIWNPSELVIRVVLQPELQATDEIQILVDDQPIPKPTGQLTATITDLERGTHNIHAHVIRSGSILISSEPVTVHIHRKSRLLNNPNLSG